MGSLKKLDRKSLYSHVPLVHYTMIQSTQHIVYMHN